MCIGGSWVECVGHADRAAFDLRVHSEKSKVDLSAYERFEKTVVVDKFVPKLNRPLLGKDFKHQQKDICDYVAGLSQTQLADLATELKTAGSSTIKMCDGATFVIKPEHVSINKESVKESGIRYLPSVIEPSFGLGRILYGILDHAFYLRDNDVKRRVLQLTPTIAPVKVSLQNVSGNIPYEKFLRQLDEECVDAHLSTKIDDSKASIGKKYARGDELGIPFAISLDKDTCDPSLADDKRMVTIRERDSRLQVQVKLSECVALIRKLCDNKLSWKQVYDTYPHFNVNEDEENKDDE